MTIAERIAELIGKHGSLRAAGRVVGIDVGYLSRLAAGEKANPTKPYLTKLGLRRVVTYERLGTKTPRRRMSRRRRELLSWVERGIQMPDGYLAQATKRRKE